MVRSIADAVVIKNQNIFFLAEPDGEVPLDDTHGLGLYYHDCRYLNGYEMKLGGIGLVPLIAAAHGFGSISELTNQETAMPTGAVIPKDTLGIKWERLLDSENLALHEIIEIRNFGCESVEFPLSLTFQAGFEDVYTVRQLLHETPGKLYIPRWTDDVLSFLYAGADKIYRSLSICFAPAPNGQRHQTALFQVMLGAGEKTSVGVMLSIMECTSLDEVETKPAGRSDLRKIYRSLQTESKTWLGDSTEIASDSLVLNKTMERSLREVHILKSTLANQTFIAAGVPWFVTLFGRDSLLTSLQMLAYAPAIAEQTLRLLATYQGRKIDPWRDEEPGKILHEMRTGELAKLDEIPHTPYYGSVDATILFLIVLARHAVWTGELSLFRELKDNVERALEWMDRYGDANGDGYIEYQCKSKKGLANQGWKDSGDSIVNEDGTLAKPPISLVEVQGYAYFAKKSLAAIYDRAGESARANELRRQAQDLRVRFNRDFWLPEKGFYALALQKGGKPAAVLSSNAAHALWSGIADHNKARRIGERVMAEDMFSGWGIRTLSTQERRYNPVGYHLGTVWPHDNSIIAAGFRHYGLDEFAVKIFTGMIEAAMHFDNTLPELFSGFRRDDYGAPVRYPVACHPQAWAAVSVPYLLETILGLVPDAFDRSLRIVRPILPPFLNRIELRRLKIGNAAVDLRFERRAHRTSVDVLSRTGEIDVRLESD